MHRKTLYPMVCMVWNKHVSVDKAEPRQLKHATSKDKNHDKSKQCDREMDNDAGTLSLTRQLKVQFLSTTRAIVRGGNNHFFLSILAQPSAVHIAQ